MKFPVFASVPLLALLMAGPAVAGPDVHAIFSVTADGWRIGELDATYKESGATYGVTLKGGAKGLFGFFLRATYDGRAEGHFDRAGRPISDVFTARSHRIFKTRQQEVDFKNGLPVKVTIDPAKDMTEMSDPKLVTAPRLDPLSFLGLFLKDRVAGCPVTANLYDGRRMTRVSFTAKTAPADSIVCDGVYQIVKGPDHSIRKGFRKFGVLLEYKKGDGATAARLDRVDFTSGSNTLVLRRVPG